MDLQFRVVTASSLLVFLLSFALSGHAQSDSNERPRARNFDVPRLPLSDALRTFSDQSGVQYGYLPTSPEEEKVLVGPLKGQYTIEDALRALLPEGFDFAWTNQRTVSVLSPIETTAPSMPTGAADGVVISDQRLIESDRRQIEAMLVRDTRLWSLEFELPSLIVLEQADIGSLGASTAAEVLEYLPQQPYMRASGLRVGGEQYADLRGLGPDSTLVLINGRRVNASATSIDWNAVDLNTIPLAAINRIEILLDSMAARAGADSTAGVINFILKDHYGAPTVEAHYGAASGGAEEARLSLGADGSFGSLSVSGLIDYFSRKELPGAERELWRDQDYRRFGSADLRSPDSNPGNITSTSFANLPGLTSRFAAVPTQDADTTLTIDDFRSTADTRNLESAYAIRSIVPAARRLSFVGSATLALPRRMSAFGELLIADRVSELHNLPTAVSSVVVPPTNPFNPFKVPVIANLRLSGVGPQLETIDALFTRVLLGLRREGVRWTSELSVLYEQDSAEHTSANALNPARVADALAQTDPSLSLNVFDDGLGAAPDVLRTLVTPSIKREFVSRETQLHATVNGLLFDLPSGSITALIGVEYRRPEVSVNALTKGDGHRSVSAAFTELQVPLWGGGHSMAGNALELNLASRWDRYDDVGNTWNSHAALAWRPNSHLQLRASFGTSFRPPSLWEMYQPVSSFPAALPDPKRHNELASHTVTVGGNPDLEPARAKSWSLGVRLKPHESRDIELAGNWWHVDIDQRLTPVTVNALFAREDLFPGRVRRAQPSEADIAAGLPGRLLALDFRSANLGRLSADGLDLSLQSAIDSKFGRFSPSVSATWISRFETVDVPGMAVDNRVAHASIFGTIPRWRVVAGLNWTDSAISVTSTVRFVSRYDDFNVLQNRSTERDIRSHALVDVQASWDLSGTVSNAPSLWKGMRLTAGVSNVFDRGPQFAEAGGYFGFDPTQGELRQRFAYARLGKRF